MSVVYSRIPGKVHYETPRLIVREIGNHKYYWNFQKQAWIRMTKRCPYLA
jgi:hypothetical protein